MTSRLSSTALVFAALATAGCASADQPAEAKAPAVEREYRTGSNIPLRSPPPLTKEERERQAEAGRGLLQNSQQGGAMGKP